MILWISGFDNVTLLNGYQDAYLKKDSSRRTVWLGRHPVEKISIGPKDKLIHVGNVEKSAKANACLTVFRRERDAELKGGLSEPSMPFYGARR